MTATALVAEAAVTSHQVPPPAWSSDGLLDVAFDDLLELAGGAAAEATSACDGEEGGQRAGWVLLFAVLLAYGVTMLRHRTAVEFASIEHAQALRDFRDHRATARARTTAPAPPPAADARIAGAAGSNPAPATTESGHVDTLERLAALRANGSITDEEFAAEEAHVMNNGT